MKPDGWGRLVGRFGDYEAATRAAQWEALKATLALGTPVWGAVVARLPFGVFLDIGVGFPALLDVTQFERSGEVRYTLETYPPEGTMVGARVVGFRDSNRQVILTQRDDAPV